MLQWWRTHKKHIHFFYGLNILWECFSCLRITTQREKKMKISQLMGVINQKEGRGHTEKMSSASFEVINKKKNSC